MLLPGLAADRSDRADVLFVCTGNAARSVMATASLTHRRNDLTVVSGGTFVVEGQPMSWRTRAAIEAVGVPVPRHASRQTTPDLLAASRLVVALAPEHVEWIRREHPSASARTLTLPRLARHLPDGDDLDTQVAALDPARVTLEPWEEVVDPGGGEAEVFAATAVEVDALVAELAVRLGR